MGTEGGRGETDRGTDRKKVNQSDEENEELNSTRDKNKVINRGSKKETNNKKDRQQSKAMVGADDEEGRSDKTSPRQEDKTLS